MTAGSLARRLRRALGGIWKEQNGASAIVVAIALPGLMGFAALGVETGVWFTIRLQTQSAADAAAISAAHQVIAGDITGGLAAAAAAAAQNGYRGSVPTVVYPYGSGTGDAVSVTLQQREGTLLAAMFLSEVTISANAVAMIEVLGNPCLLALETSGTGVEISNSSRLDMPNCAVAANSVSRNAIDLHSSSSTIAASTLVTTGQVSFQGIPIDPAAAPSEFALASPVRIGAPSVADPYSGVLTHAFLTAGMPTLPSCRSRNSNRVRVYDGNCVVAGTSLTQQRIRLSAGTQISGPWTVSTTQSVDLSPGTYWVTGGDLTVQSSGTLKCSTCDNVRGIGVTVILTRQSNRIGTVSIASSATINLNAPGAGRFAGLVMIQDANGLPGGTGYTSSHSTLTGSPAAIINGLVYFPNSSMTFRGNPSPTGPRCLLLVVGAAVVAGSSSLESAGCASVGLASLPKVYTVALAE